MGSDSNRTNASGGDGAGGGGVLQMPPSTNKVVQNLKEIVNDRCTDSEIYAVLRDCNMDPNDAVQRLLSQDTFHEVKSKRERRKEVKETQELKSRANGRASNRGVIDAGEYLRSGSILNSSNEPVKAAYERDSGSVTAYIPYSASLKLRPTGQTWNRQISPLSNSFSADSRRQSIGTGDMIDSSMRPSYGSQSSWVGGTSEHVDMADIVRMGRPKRKGSQLPYSPQDVVPPNSTIYQMKPSIATSDLKLGTDQDLYSSDLSTTSESGKRSSQHGFDNEWDVNKPMTTSTDIGGTMFSNQSYLHSNGANSSSNCWSESNGARKNLSLNHVSSAQESNKQRFTSDSEGTSEYDDDLCKDTNSPDSCEQIYEPVEGRGSDASAPNPTASLTDDVIKAASSVAVNLQRLSLGKEEVALTPKEDNCGVVLPNYLQAFSADCSHLSFGTYKSGKSTALSQPQTSSSLTNDLEENLKTLNGHSSSMHMNSRNLVYHDEEQREFDFDRHRETADARSYNSPNLSQSELRKLDIPDAATLGNDYVSCASTPASSFKNIQQAISSSSFVIDPNAGNLSIYPSEVQLYSNSMPSDLLAAAIPSTKARDAAAFLASQSISSRYIGLASSIKNPIAFMSQAPHGANPATEPVPEEHLYAYPYPQSGYQAVPQGHTYPPSALHQAFPDGNVFRESHPEIKYDLQPYTRVSTCSSLPWSSSYTSGYRSVENPSNSPGNFLQNLLAGSAGSKVGYDDFLRLQYNSNRGANFNLLQKKDGSATWNHGHGSRTISTIPDNAYNSLHGPNYQFAAGYQQDQQQSQQFHRASGYPGNYNSQEAIAIEQQLQQQNLRDFILNASHGPSSRQSRQTWQHNY